jgi:hypothetical protein
MAVTRRVPRPATATSATRTRPVKKDLPAAGRATTRRAAAHVGTEVRADNMAAILASVGRIEPTTTAPCGYLRRLPAVGWKR